jgi:hypothetical protein
MWSDIGVGTAVDPWNLATGIAITTYGMSLVVGALFALAYLVATWPGLGPEAGEPEDTPLHPAQDVQPNYARDDSDTHVIPHIPGATPADTMAAAALERFLNAVDAAAEEAAVVCDETGLTPIDGLREERIEDVPTEAIERVRTGLAPAEETQPVDLCPLTTQDIAVPADVSLPLAAEAAAHRNRRQETQDLTVNLAEILGRERVA